MDGGEHPHERLVNRLPVGGGRNYCVQMRVRPVDLVDVFVYLVVLGLFIQWFPDVISETFTLALLTAILFKGVLELVTAVKKRIIGCIRGSGSGAVRTVNVLALLLVLPGSKFVVLELVAWLFGGAVSLGGFLPGDRTDHRPDARAGWGASPRPR